MQEMQVCSLSQEDSLEEGMATHSSILARIVKVLYISLCLQTLHWSSLHLLLLLLSHFSRVRLCATPSLGFSRQEHWSGLPFPSPMHKSEKWKWSRSVMSDSWRPHGLQSTRLLHPRDFPGKSTGVGCHCLLHLLVIKEPFPKTVLGSTSLSKQRMRYPHPIP